MSGFETPGGRDTAEVVERFRHSRKPPAFQYALGVGSPCLEIGQLEAPIVTPLRYLAWMYHGYGSCFPRPFVVGNTRGVGFGLLLVSTDEWLGWVDKG